MRRLLAVLLFASACTGSAYIVTQPDDGPPPQREEAVTYRPGFVWVHGHWDRSNRRWAWRDGYYARERPDYVYVEGRWVRNGGRHVWVDGTWRRHDGG
jgi:hypothetical protein